MNRVLSVLLKIAKDRAFYLALAGGLLTYLAQAGYLSTELAAMIGGALGIGYVAKEKAEKRALKRQLRRATDGFDH